MKTTLLILLVFLADSLSAQWPKVYGHDTFDMTGRSILESYDGGIFITGAERLWPGAELQGYILKTDINGSVLWKRHFCTDYSTNVLGLSQYPDGSIIISGEIWHSYYEDRDGFIAKINSCGEKEWCKIIPEPGSSSSFRNLIVANGDIIVLGGIWDYSFNRIWLYRLNSTGSLIWKSTLIPDTTYFQETGFDMILTGDSCLLVDGFAYSFREPNLGWPTPFWLKMNLDGNQVWTLPWIITTHNVGDYGRTCEDIHGYFYSGGNYGNETKQDACIYKFTNEGDTLKHMVVFNGGEASIIKAVDFFQDSTLFLGMAWANGSYGYSKVMKCDTTGVVIKTKDVPLTGMAVNFSVLSHDNKIYGLSERTTTAGTFHWETCLLKFNQDLEYDSIYNQPRSYDSLCPGTINPEAVFSLDCELVGIEEQQTSLAKDQLKIYPVPAYDLISIELPESYTNTTKTNLFTASTTHYQFPMDTKMEICNLSGQMKYSDYVNINQRILQIDISQWEAGFYIIRLISKENVLTEGKFVKY